MSEEIKILFFADSHLGYDLPLRPRIQRRRRGEDFFSNYNQILTAARHRKVDLVVHGGDLFTRSKVPPAIIDRAYQSLLEVANSGIPTYIVPGNHERSRLPEHLFLAHEAIRIFSEPTTFLQEVKGKQVALSGFPFARQVRGQFAQLLQATGWDDVEADVRFLCAHQTFEGAQVGPANFTFREGPDNIPPEWVPGDFTAVLSGHIHRTQVLEQALEGQPLLTPVIYPGSIERTSIAERFEDKSYQLIRLSWVDGKPIMDLETQPLLARPMVKVIVPVRDYAPEQILVHIRSQLVLIKPDAVVRVELTGRRAEGVQRSISAASLRAAAPGSMNISFGLNMGAPAGA